MTLTRLSELGAAMTEGRAELEDAAGGHVDGVIGDTDPYVAVCEMLARELTKLGFKPEDLGASACISFWISSKAACAIFAS